MPTNGGGYNHHPLTLLRHTVVNSVQYLGLNCVSEPLQLVHYRAQVALFR